MIKWFQNWVKGKAAEAGSAIEGSVAKESTLWDVAHEVLKPRFFNRERKKLRVKSKVKEFLSPPLVDDSSVDMVDEITETVTEACEVDPKIDRLFGES